MTRRLRVLQIAPYPILPTSAGGKIRIAQLARALCRLGVDLTIVTPYHVTQRTALARREPFTLRQVPYPPFGLARLLVDRPFPYGMLASFHPGYHALLPISPASYDVFQIDHPAFVDLLRGVPQSIPVVYGSQNVEYDYVSAECPPGLVRRLAGNRVHALEARLVRQAHHVFACTDADRTRFSDLYGIAPERISVLPNGVDLAATGRAASPQGRRPRRAIFAGSDVAHNRAIMLRLAPALASDIEFVIVGPCAKRAASAGSARNVRLDPRGDLLDYAGNDAVGINPVVTGSGSSLKLLQYLAHNLPVLSTPFGIRGHEDLSRWVVVAELDRFADALRGEFPSVDGVRTALATYDWNAVATHALSIYEGLVTRG